MFAFRYWFLAGCTLLLTSLSCLAIEQPSDGLKVVLIRHGEKQKTGENLTCQGENRARQLSAVLYNKFNAPSDIYVPALGSGIVTNHARMFQTISPFAIRYNLSINSKFSGTDYSSVAKSIFEKTGTVLLVWNHSSIPSLVARLGVNQPPRWADDDFDSIWIITYAHGKAALSIDKEGLSPPPDCMD
jgi:hypothetical protein